MDRLTQLWVLLLLGGVTLAVALGDAHLAYVRPGFRPLLLGAGAVLLLLGLAGLLRERSPGGAHGHGAPRVAWLLLLPVTVVLLVAPPALGSFTAARQALQVQAAAQPPAPGIGPDDPGEQHRTMALLEYSLHALAADTSALDGRLVRLTGFVTPREGGGWYVSRIGIKCCAADAVAVTVVVDAERGDLAADQWVEVVGSWAPPRPHPAGGHPEAVVAPRSVTPIEAPANTYQG
ncbi:TIGR03943 family putative permease subunit [Geodermatophilus sp. DSM 44513]|uniref:TIGR03943 family putative permease subunit n=1 Tax=Geodermatophilus sp. DSM 44513 TaxID=1528104 RepID=UPI00126CA66C|nr:TIGR03943 family protein [Geodermatophilus sp. DSM 44513]WNV76932.1 TIGR03943 family protein [Geodermatophilus sp. DSM 44513]